MASATAVAPARNISDHILDNAPRFLRSASSWYTFFFISGFPALLYQIIWQRSLFTLYGVNVESVTVVVTAFMLGLGLGSLLGGMVSRHRHWPLLAFFGMAELLIALYGFCSLPIFHWAASFTAGSPPLKTGVIAFALVAVPTLLMGSTLPVLVSYTVRFTHSVGISVGALYAANTLGSAAACFAAGLFLMRWLGEWKTVALAAGLNTIVGASVLLYHFAYRERERRDDVDGAKFPIRNMAPNTHCAVTVKFASALGAAGVAGFVSLGYEIVWYHMFSFTTGGAAKSFAFLLGAYLAGIGGGALAVNRLCQRIADQKLFARFLVTTVFAANLLGFLVGPILFNLVTRVSHLWSLVPIATAAAGLGAIFPLLCHMSISPNERAGAYTSYLYVSNIAGSVAGSYLTGFVFMDMLPIRKVCVLLTLLGLVLGAALLPQAKPGRFAWPAALGVCITCYLVVWASMPLYAHMYEKMLLKSAYAFKQARDYYLSGSQFPMTVENKSGVILVTKKGIVFGGGSYDGRFNVSLVDDFNGIERAFALSYIHPSPKDVLMIGLSSGSWAQVIANHPQVEHLTIVEINPGYLRLIASRPEVANILRNPKVHIEIDDGRRWLVRNHDRKFDAIVMNTTYNWRSNVTNLLSVEFLQLVRQHLNPGGIHFYNTTDSLAALATGVKVFPYSLRIANFLAVSDSPLQLDAGRWRNVLVSYTIDGKPVFDLSRESDRQRLEEVLAMAATMDQDDSKFFSVESAEHLRSRAANSSIITDDNMGSEWLR